jgi:beta-lactamase regulating signal transducer with metallopeptidase domain
MIEYIYKSSLVLFLFFVFYKVFLENEKMHLFNRFYLLFALLLSINIPFLNIKTETEIPFQILRIKASETNSINQNLPTLNNYNWKTILATLSIIMTILFIIRFIKNLSSLYKRIKVNQSIIYKNTKIILLDDVVNPYSFFNHIFINKKEFQSNKIQEEILSHELVHVHQKHSIDIIFIELLKALFWFNPIIYAYKKAIQLNHEFLADEHVINKHKNISFYQKLLLENQAITTSNLASNLNYLTTKKRIIMMTKTTSEKNIFLRKTLVLPVLLLSFTISCVKDNNSSKAKESHKLEVVASTNENITKPDFKNDAGNFSKYILSNYQLTEFDKKNKKLEVRFLVNKDGSLSNLKALNTENNLKEREILEVLKKSPKWVPAKLDGEVINFQMRVVLL